MNNLEEVGRILRKWEKYWSYGLDEKFMGLDLEYRDKIEEVTVIQIGPFNNFSSSFARWSYFTLIIFYIHTFNSLCSASRRD